MRSTKTTLPRLFGVALVFAAATAFAAPVGAHTDFDFSLPTDGATVGEPVSEVTVAFTLPVTLVGNGFEVLDPQENLLQPFAVTDDDTLFRLQFDPPLAGGTVGVRYTVTAEDGHTLSGSFSFTVSVDLPAPTTAAPTLPPIAEPEPEPAPASTATATAAPTETSPEVAAAAEITAPQALVAAADEAATQPVSDESNGSRVVIWVAVAVAALAAVFLAVRARTSR
jgi:methionine-rich copper-binding protein CopC